MQGTLAFTTTLWTASGSNLGPGLSEKHVQVILHEQNHLVFNKQLLNKLHKLAVQLIYKLFANIAHRYGFHQTCVGGAS